MQIGKTEKFAKWIDGLSDIKARAKGMSQAAR